MRKTSEWLRKRRLRLQARTLERVHEVMPSECCKHIPVGRTMGADNHKQHTSILPGRTPAPVQQRRSLEWKAERLPLGG